jgi:hypothetical protein
MFPCGRVLHGSELRDILDKDSIINLAHSLHQLPDTISDLDRVLYTYARSLLGAFGLTTYQLP